MENEDEERLAIGPGKGREYSLSLQARVAVLEQLCAELIHRLPEADRNEVTDVLRSMERGMDDLNAEEPGWTALGEATHQFNLAARNMLRLITSPASVELVCSRTSDPDRTGE